MTSLPAAPISLEALTQCSDSISNYQIIAAYNPFTNTTFSALHAQPCSDNDKENSPPTANYEAVPVIVDGLFPHHHKTMPPTMYVPEETKAMHFGGRVEKSLKYEINIYEVSRSVECER